MKILIVNKYHYLRGGDCRYFFELLNLLRENGHEVAEFSMHHPKNIPSLYSKNFVSYIDFPEELRKKGLGPKAKVLLRMLYSKEARTKFSKMLDEFKPDIIHLNNIHKHLTTSILLEAKKRKIPVVWTLHDYNLICPNISFISHGKICERCRRQKYIGPMLEKCSNNSLAASAMIAAENSLHHIQKVKNKVNYFISPSAFLKEKFVEYGFSENKIRVLPNFSSNPDKENASENENEFPGVRYFLYLGRLSHEKGIETLCKAAQEAEVNVWIAGDGPLKEELQQKYGSARIQFLGYKTGDELANLRKNAWFVVIPSEWYENNPYSVIESFSDLVPVIGAEIGGIPELVREGETGYLFPSGDAESLARILKNASLMDEEQRNVLGKSGQQQVKTFNNNSAYYKSLVEIYVKAITEEKAKWKLL